LNDADIDKLNTALSITVNIESQLTNSWVVAPGRQVLDRVVEERKA